MELHACRLESSSGNVLSPTDSTGNSRVLPQVVAHVSLGAPGFHRPERRRVATPGSVRRGGVGAPGVGVPELGVPGLAAEPHAAGPATDPVSPNHTFLVLRRIHRRRTAPCWSSHRPTGAEPHVDHLHRRPTAWRRSTEAPMDTEPAFRRRQGRSSCGSAQPDTATLRFGTARHRHVAVRRRPDRHTPATCGSAPASARTTSGSTTPTPTTCGSAETPETRTLRFGDRRSRRSTGGHPNS